MEKENPPRLLRAHQKHAALIASRGWKSSNSSPLSVEGEVFSLTFPFIEQSITPTKRPGASQASFMLLGCECNRDFSPTTLLRYRQLHGFH